jgi:uroporphyrinogen-III decarboxylase
MADSSGDGRVFASDRMTSRQRLLAALHGQETDRVPYWAKVCNDTWRTTQPADVRQLTDRQLLDYIHADGLFGTPSVIRQVRPHVTIEHELIENGRTQVTHTPDGDLVERWQQDAATRSWHPVEFPVKSAQDVRRYRWLYRDVGWETNAEGLQKARARMAEIGQRGIGVTGCGTSPLMELVEHAIGPENVHFMLADCPDLMEELIALMHESRCRQIKAIAQATPADVIVSVENTSTTLISPPQFLRWCHPHLCEYGRIIEGEGKLHELHMCGLLLALLPWIDTIGACSIEAFTAPTLGNTRLADGRAKAPSKTLIGGTNCMVWLRPLEQIKRFIEGEIRACPDRRRIILTTAGVAPPACSADTFRQVGQWLAGLAL